MFLTLHASLLRRCGGIFTFRFSFSFWTLFNAQQRVTEVSLSFWEVTTSRSRVVFNGLCPGWLANFLLSISVSFRVSTFESLVVVRKFLPRLSAMFLSGRGSLIGQLSFSLVPNMVLSKKKNHEHRTK